MPSRSCGHCERTREIQRLYRRQDLTLDAGAAWLKEILADKRVDYVHFDVPAGTMSRARELPPPWNLVEDGMATPGPFEIGDRTVVVVVVRRRQ